VLINYTRFFFKNKRLIFCSKSSLL